MKKLAFCLFIGVICPISLIVVDKINSHKNYNEGVRRRDLFEEELWKSLSNWNVAEASYYDSKDPKQTRENCDGIGAFDREIKSGSIALGSHLTSMMKSKDLIVYVKIKDIDIETPYGKGIFRVDDAMAKRYRKEGKFFMDFLKKDLNIEKRRLGRFKVQFKIHKIVKTASTLECQLFFLRVYA